MRGHRVRSRRRDRRIYKRGLHKTKLINVIHRGGRRL